MHRNALSALLSISLLFGTVAPALAEPHVLRFADGQELTEMNWLTPGGAAKNYLSQMTGAFLTRWGTGRASPELITVVPSQANGGISADGKTITWHLRKDAKWSDGTALTSTDVAFSVELFKKPETIITDKHDFLYIDRVDTPSAQTAVFHLTRPYGIGLHAYFASDTFPILPKHLLDGKDVNKDAFWNQPVGAGPFKIAKFVRGERVELERNPYYFRGSPKLEKIVYKIIPQEQTTINSLKAGEIDYYPAMPATEYRQFGTPPSVPSVTIEGARPSWFVLNQQSKIVSDIVIRRALRLALNRPGILQRTYLGGGVLNESYLPPYSPEFDKDLSLVKYDPAAASAMLDADGWKRGPDGIRVKNGTRLHLLVTGGAANAFVDQILEQARSDWAAVGIEIETKRYQTGMYFAPVNEGGIIYGGKFDLALFSVGSAMADSFPSAFGCSLIPPNGANYFRYCNKQLQPILDRIERTYDTATLDTLYRQTQKILYDDIPFIVIASRNEYYAHTDAVIGLHIPPYGPFDDMMSVDVAK